MHYIKRVHKKTDRSEAAKYINRRYAQIYKRTQGQATMNLSVEAMGLTNTVEKATKAVLEEKAMFDDPMLSYLLGKFDSKLMNQGALVLQRRNALLAMVRPDFEFSYTIELEDMLMAYNRMKVRNWYVRGVINFIHYRDCCSIDRTVPMSQYDILDRACTLLLARVDENGIINYTEALKEMRNRKEMKQYSTHKGLVDVLAQLHRLHFVTHIKSSENNWEVASDDTEVKLLLRDRKWVAPEIKFKRSWDEAIDRNVKMKFERMGLRLT